MKRRNLLKGLLVAPFMKPSSSKKPIKEPVKKGLKYPEPSRSQNLPVTTCSYTTLSWYDPDEPFGVEIFKQKGDK